MPTFTWRALLRAVLPVFMLAFLAAHGLSGQSSTHIHGVVRDGSSGGPLGGVHIVAGSRAIMTNAQGAFVLQVGSDSTTVHFHRLGYTTLTVQAGDVTGDVLLFPRPVLLDGLVVDGRQTRQLAAGTALTVTSTDRESVHARGATSLADALIGVEGLSVSRPGAWGAKATLRGISGERLAIMIDGNRVNRACVFGMDQGLATLDPSVVERVEVLTGPGSTLYGSGNIGGVINVVTRRGADLRPIAGEVRSGLSAGVPGGTMGGSLWLRGSSWDLSTSIDAAQYGDYRTAVGPVTGSGFSQGTGDVKLNYTPAVGHRVLMQGQLYEARDIGWPGSPGHEMSIPREGRGSLSLDYGWQRGEGILDALSARAFVQRLDHHMTMHVRMAGGAHTAHGQGTTSHSAHAAHAGPSGHAAHPEGDQGGTHGDGTSPGMHEAPFLSTTTTDARSHSTTSGGRVQVRMLPSPRSHIDAGLELTRWSAEATRWTETLRGSGGDPERVTLRSWPGVRITDIGAFGQGELGINAAVTASAGARLDRVDRRADGHAPGHEWIGTGNLGTRLDLGRGFGARTSLGFGYRIPDPTELFGTAVRPDGLYRGSPDLRTETSRNVEASLSYDVTTFGASTTVFRNDLHDLITVVTVPHETEMGRPVRTYANLAEARLAGGTGALRWQPAPGFETRGSATYVHGVDRLSGNPLAQIPPLEATLTLRLLPEARLDWVELEGRAAVSQNRIAASEVATPAYGLLNLRGGFTAWGTGLTVGVENILNAHYRAHLDPANLHRPGRNVYVKLSRSF